MYIPTNIAADIRQRYQTNMSAFPLQKIRADAAFAHLPAVEQLLLQHMLGTAPAADLLRYAPVFYRQYATATMAAGRQFGYMRHIPPALLLTWVLTPRVNNETLDDSRPALLAAIAPHVKKCKTLSEAALQVNYWCAAQGTYTPSDDRTLGPAAFRRAGAGRCGEESIFAVNALRAAGIPARQCYAPRWAHCDDNHAWVEFWTEDGWHYFGACEPEPKPDRGWFTGAASRAMVVHTRAVGTLDCGEQTLNQNPHGRLIHTTARYAATAILTVRLHRDGVPVKESPVQFRLANESRFFTVYTAFTDADGLVRFETGLGSLLVRAMDGDAAVERPADLRQDRSIQLDLAAARTPAQLVGGKDTLQLVPPTGTGLPLPPLPKAVAAQHQKRLTACETARAARAQTWYSGAADDPRTLARGNRDEIEVFLADERFDAADKTTLLSTLRPKDFLDVTAAVLADTLANALPYRAALPPELWRTAVLAPRVENEPLTVLPTALRRSLRRLHPDVPADGGAVWQTLQQSLTLLPETAPAGCYADPAVCLEYGRIPAGSVNYVYTALCRALGIPARLCPLTARPQYWQNGSWLAADTAAPAPLAQLQLQNGADAPLYYGRQYTLALWQDGDWHTLPAAGTVPERLVNTADLTLPQGYWQLTAMTRQPDGTASVCRQWFCLPGTQALTVTPPPDETIRCLKKVPLTPLLPRQLLPHSPAGGLLLWVQPGAEPTEHLLQELLALQNDWNATACTLTVLTPLDGFDRPLLAKLTTRLQRAQLLLAPPTQTLAALQKAMGQADARLPFALAFDKHENGLIGFANYNIDTAAALLRILRETQ